jgi:hypothetical protein
MNVREIASIISNVTAKLRNKRLTFQAGDKMKKLKAIFYQEDTKFTWERYEKEREQYLTRVLKY